MRYVRIIFASLMWGGSIYFSGKKNYNRGLFFLLKSEKYRGKSDAEMLLLKGFLLAMTDRVRDAEFVLNLAEKKILESRRLNDDEKIYLYNYRLILLCNIKDNFSSPKLKSYDGKNVSKHLKENHPYS